MVTFRNLRLPFLITTAARGGDFARQLPDFVLPDGQYFAGGFVSAYAHPEQPQARISLFDKPREMQNGKNPR